MALLIEIADAVVSELNDPASGFDPPLSAVRHYRPQFELAELKALKVTVVPRGIQIASIGRSLNQYDAAVDVAVQKKLVSADNAELDGLMALVDQIGEFFRLRRLSALPSALWIKTENLPVYSPEHLEQHRVFTSVLTLTFRVMK